jgi:hypothetical protein
VETHDPLNSENVNVTTRNRTHAAISHERPKKAQEKRVSKKPRKLEIVQTNDKTNNETNGQNERQKRTTKQTVRRTTKRTAKRTTKTSFVKEHEQHAANEQSNYV